MALIGPGYLADNVEHGAALTTRVKETLNLVRQLDVASRLLTFRIDELSGQLNRHGVKPGAATDNHVDTSEEDSRRGDGGCGSGKKRARASGGHAHVDDGACVNTKQKKRKAAAFDTIDTSRKDDGVAATRAGKKHGDRAQLERLKRAALRCADEKVALAAHLYELLDLQIRYIDSDLRRFEKHYGFIPPVVPPPPAAPLSRRRSEHLTKEREPSQTSASDDVSTNGAGIHPNEPTYCFCRQVAFGEMIACDNLNCEIEWFHYGCVGLTKPPGTWMCRNCKKTLRSRSLGGAVASSSSL